MYDGPHFEDVVVNGRMTGKSLCGQELDVSEQRPEFGIPNVMVNVKQSLYGPG
jgi:hypothetical protein